MMMRRTLLFLLGLSIVAMPAAANAAGEGSGGTLHFRIVLGGQATSRSAGKNVADAKELGLPLPAIASSETVRRVVEGSIHLEGGSDAENPLAGAAQRKEFEAEQDRANATAGKTEEQFEKAMRACMSGNAIDSDCMQRVSHEFGPDADSVANKAVPPARFKVWRAAAPCRLKLKVTDRAQGIVFAGAAAGAEGEVYRLSNDDTNTVNCAAKPAQMRGLVLLAADTSTQRYSLRLPQFSVPTNATKTWEEAGALPGEGMKQRRGRSSIPYMVALPEIVIRNLEYPGSGKTLHGRRDLKTVTGLTGAMGIDSIEFSGGGGAPVQASLPLDAVVTWTFTPD